MRFWFDLGASGFRVDMAGSLVKNDPDGRATAALWHEFRAWMDREYPDRALVSSGRSLGSQSRRASIWIPPAVQQTGYKSSRPTTPEATAFFDSSGRGDIRRFLDEFEPLYAATRDHGFIAIPTGIMTVPRLGDGKDPRELDVAYAFLLTMPGVPFIYYGDEIGLRSVAGLPSKEGGFGRTGARTPMQWDASPNAGFSAASADRLYLPIDLRQTVPPWRRRRAIRTRR